MNDFYVYVLFRPWNGIPCYVGKGRGRRWKRHEGNCRNPHLKAIITKAGGTIPKVKVREDISEVAAFETEVALIAAIGRGEKGPLVNTTDGGEGFSGGRHTSESKKRIAVAQTGRVKSSEHLSAISRALKSSEKAKMQLVALQKASRGRAKRPETIEKIRASLSGTTREPYSAEHCAAISAGKVAGWARRKADIAMPCLPWF